MTTKQRDQSNEKALWELYLQKCKDDETEPSVEGFVAWTKSLMKNM